MIKELFDSTEINGLELRNRFVRSATWEGMANDDGSSTEGLADRMVELAEGEVGLIISGHAYVSKQGQAGPWQLGIYSDELNKSLGEMTSVVHAVGGRICLQLAHAGFRAPSELTLTEAIGPSNRKADPGPACREMSKKDIDSVVESFAAAAGRAQSCGFDGVQIHAAHGYLLSQFLSPAYNHRKDDYGGPLENRARVVLEVLAAIRSEVGPQFPVMIKLNSEDFLQKGLTVDEMLELGPWLQRQGIDAIELSGGTGDSGKFVPVRLGKIGSEEKEAYYRNASRQLKEKVDIPVILVGGIRSYNAAEYLLKEEFADYFALSRPLIREPNLIQRWKAGDRRKAECLSDNLCFKPIRSGQGMYCYAEELISKRKRP
jgi:2,4-dienoyl-CoA reductase-like NADH-dependent reductase (Old Yellow Enzyme family)